jgi:hypothetical protein
MSVDRILDVLGDLIYGTMFTNHFSQRQVSVEAQARDIIDVVFHGILNEAGRERHPPERASQDGPCPTRRQRASASKHPNRTRIRD